MTYVHTYPAVVYDVIYSLQVGKQREDDELGKLRFEFSEYKKRSINALRERYNCAERNGFCR
jgi:hypothetical protein